MRKEKAAKEKEEKEAEGAFCKLKHSSNPPYRLISDSPAALPHRQKISLSHLEFNPLQTPAPSFPTPVATPPCTSHPSPPQKSLGSAETTFWQRSSMAPARDLILSSLISTSLTNRN